MKHKPLTTLQIALCNIRSKPFRSACLGIVVGILAFTLFGGSVLASGLENGMRSMQKRLGADIMVVPKGYKEKTEGILLRGEPNYFYLDEAAVESISKIRGIKFFTTQFFLISMADACCSIPIQMIGFDPKTDFVILPWITQKYKENIGEGQLVVGGEIKVKNGKLKFFSHEYEVTARLDKTASGLDSSIFMTMDTLSSMLEGTRTLGYNFIPEQKGAVSTVLIKAESDQDITQLAENISDNVEGVDVIVSKSMFSGIAEHLDSLLVYIRIFSAELLAVSLFVLFLIFSLTANSRKREFSIFRIVGASGRKLVGIVLGESALLSLFGSILGISAAAVTILPFSEYIGARLSLPFLRPEPGVILSGVLVSLLLAFTAGPAASIYSAVKISRAEAYTTLRDGE